MVAKARTKVMQVRNTSGPVRSETGFRYHSSRECSSWSCPLAAEGAWSHPQAQCPDWDQACSQFSEEDSVGAGRQSTSAREGMSFRADSARSRGSVDTQAPLGRSSAVRVDQEIHHRYQQPESLYFSPQTATSSENAHPLSAPLASIRLLWAGSALVLVISLLAYALFANDYGADSYLFAPWFESGKPSVELASAKGIFADKQGKESRLQWGATEASPASKVHTGGGTAGNSDRKPLPAVETPASKFPTGAESETGGCIPGSVSGGGAPVPTEREGSVSEECGPKSPDVSARDDDSQEATSLGVVSRQLQLVDAQRQGYALALELMRGRPGAFSGFFPERAIPGLSYIKSFEARIVDLEMRKKALGVRFKPKSREIQLIDQEINGIRDAMKEYIGEQIVFLQKRRETLCAQKTRLERKLGKSGPTKGLSRLNWWPDRWTMGPQEGPSSHLTPDEGAVLSGRADGESNNLGSVVVSVVKKLVALGRETLDTFPFSSSLEPHITLGQVYPGTRE